MTCKQTDPARILRPDWQVTAIGERRPSLRKGSCLLAFGTSHRCKTKGMQSPSVLLELELNSLLHENEPAWSSGGFRSEAMKSHHHSFSWCRQCLRHLCLIHYSQYCSEGQELLSSPPPDGWGNGTPREFVGHSEWEYTASPSKPWAPSVFKFDVILSKVFKIKRFSNIQKSTENVLDCCVTIITLTIKGRHCLTSSKLSLVQSSRAFIPSASSVCLARLPLTHPPSNLLTMSLTGFLIPLGFYLVVIQTAK